MKLTYWHAANLTEYSQAYAIRTKTKREALELIKAHYDPDSFGPLTKVTVEYADAFDLLDQCSCEGSLSWEPTP